MNDPKRTSHFGPPRSPSTWRVRTSFWQEITRCSRKAGPILPPTSEAAKAIRCVSGASSHPRPRRSEATSLWGRLFRGATAATGATESATQKMRGPFVRKQSSSALLFCRMSSTGVELVSAVWPRCLVATRLLCRRGRRTPEGQSGGRGASTTHPCRSVP